MDLSDQAVSDIEGFLDDIARASARIRALLHSPMPPADALAASSAMAGLPVETAAPVVLAEPNEEIAFSIVEEQPLSPKSFAYRWPSGEEKYIDATRYTVRRDDTEYVFVVGAEDGGRSAYGRADRGRIVVFLRKGTSEYSYYPLLEFVESDIDPDLYAALIPKLDKTTSRAMATVGDLANVRQVPHLQHADLRRADEVFTSSANAPTLRILVRRDDPTDLITHSWWVGQIRGTSSK